MSFIMNGNLICDFLDLYMFLTCNQVYFGYFLYDAFEWLLSGLVSTTLVLMWTESWRVVVSGKKEALYSLTNNTFKGGHV